VYFAEFDGLCSADIYPIDFSNSHIISRFAYHVMLGEAFYKSAVAASMRSGIPKVNRDDLASIEIPVPPSDEQQRIVAVLDAWDQAIEQTERLIVAKRRYRVSRIKSVLSLQNSKEALSKVVTVNMGQSPSSIDYNDSGNGLPLVQGAGDFDEWGLRPTGWTTSAPKSAGAGSIIMSVRAPVGLWLQILMPMPSSFSPVLFATAQAGRDCHKEHLSKPLGQTSLMILNWLGRVLRPDQP
jgi:restriction endonuclease S subunit